MKQLKLKIQNDKYELEREILRRQEELKKLMSKEASEINDIDRMRWIDLNHELKILDAKYEVLKMVYADILYYEK